MINCIIHYSLGYQRLWLLRKALLHDTDKSGPANASETTRAQVATPLIVAAGVHVRVRAWWDVCVWWSVWRARIWHRYLTPKPNQLPTYDMPGSCAASLARPAHYVPHVENPQGGTRAHAFAARACSTAAWRCRAA